MTTALPASARLAWWGTSWLRGQVPTDLMIDAVLDIDVTHSVVGLAEETQTLLGALATLRSVGATAVGAAFPVEGDPVGLGGPTAFNRAALEAGEAVVAIDAATGLVPNRTGPTVTWIAHPADRRQVSDIGEADRGLRAALLESGLALADLDVAGWRPEVADRLLNLRHREVVAAPPGVPSRCVELAARGMQATEIVELALEDDGGALTAYQVDVRRSALLPWRAPDAEPWSLPAP